MLTRINRVDRGYNEAAIQDFEWNMDKFIYVHYNY